jgi:hypothetical protein
VVEVADAVAEAAVVVVVVAVVADAEVVAASDAEKGKLIP